MTTSFLKRELHKAIDTIDDNSLLAAIYTILKRESSNDYDLLPEQYTIAAERREKYIAGKSKTVTMAQIRKKVMKRLKK